MTILQSLTIVAALFAGGTSMAMAQNGLPTGGEHPVAGGAAGGPYGYFYHPWTGRRIAHGYGHLYNYYRPHRRYWHY